MTCNNNNNDVISIFIVSMIIFVLSFPTTRSQPHTSPQKGLKGIEVWQWMSAVRGRDHKQSSSAFLCLERYLQYLHRERVLRYAPPCLHGSPEWTNQTCHIITSRKGSPRSSLTRLWSWATGGVECETAAAWPPTLLKQWYYATERRLSGARGAALVWGGDYVRAVWKGKSKWKGIGLSTDPTPLWRF